MKKHILLLLCCFSISLFAKTSDNYTINEKFIFHKLEVLETGTDKVLDSFSEGSGMIIDATVENKNFLLISIPDVHTDQLLIVNKVVDTPKKDLKIVMYQGGETIENLGTYTANIFFVYDMSKNKNVPELIRLEINNSPNIMQYSGLISVH